MPKKEKDGSRKKLSDLQEKLEGEDTMTDTNSMPMHGSRRSAVISSDGVRLNSQEKVSVRLYDFSNPSILDDRRLDRIVRLHKDMISALEAQAALFLRSQVSITFSDLKVIEYKKLIKDLDQVTHLALFRGEPLTGVGFMEISPGLAFGIVNQILGGNGQAPNVERALTKIETDLVEEFVVILLQDWVNHWKLEATPVISVVGHESVPAALQLCEPSAVVMRLSLDVSVRGCEGRIQIAVPLFMIEPMIRFLESKTLTKVEPTSQVRVPSWQQGYVDVPLPATVIVKAGNIKVGDFNNLKVGDTLPLPEDCMEHAILRLSNKSLFRGQYGVDNGKMALCIQSKL